MRFSEERALAVTRNIFTNPPEFRRLFADFRFCSPRRLAGLTPSVARQGGFDRIVFANPYQDSSTMRLYQACRADGFPYLVCERGALPGTVFLDETGFLSDSTMYDPQHWRDLTIDDAPERLATFRKIYLDRPDLEQQAAAYRPAGRARVGGGRPRVLIALQDSNDTAVRIFSETDRTYQDFLHFVEGLCSNYGADFELMYKPHPRELSRVVPGAPSVAHLHIVDALEQVDAVVTYSSGVGILAMLMGLPVAFYGVPFYRHCGAAWHVPDDTAFERFGASLGEKQWTVEGARFLTHLSRLYSDVAFFGQRLSREGRDLLCRYLTVRFVDRGGYGEERDVRREVSPLSGLEPWLRVLKNRTGISPDNW